MKAIVADRYGSPDVLALRDVELPVVKDDEVLVRVRAASVHPDVWHVLTGRPYVLRLMGSGLTRPKQQVPGTDVAGQVEAVGSGVTRFRPGEEVLGETLRGHQWRHGGAFAEYVSVPQEALAAKPPNVTFAQAAAVPTAGLIALMNLPEGRPKPDQHVLINGAGGGVGAIAAQLAKAYGARVTGVDSATKLDLVRSLGADQVIDFAQEDFTAGDHRYDLIFDVPGNRPFSACRRVLSPDGLYVLIGHDYYGRAGRRWLGSLPTFARLMVFSAFMRQLPRPSLSTPSKQEMMSVLRDLLAAGKLTAVVDRTYPLSDVPEALRYLTEGNSRGRVVITM